MKYFNVSILVLAVLFGLSCDSKENYQMRVEVKTNVGDPIAGAEIRVEKDTVGKTDEDGFFSKEIALQAGEKVKLEVMKESAEFYFAPYFKRFTVPEIDGEDNSLAFQAILYSVPKPKIEVSKSSKSSSENTEPSENENHLAENSAKEKKSPDSVTPESLAAEPESSAAPITATTATLATTEAKQAENLDAEDVKQDAKKRSENLAALDEKTDELKPAETNTADEPLDVLAANGVEAPLLKPSENSKAKEVYPKAETKSQGDQVFTIQAFNKRKGLGGVTLYKGEDKKGELREICSTDKRGRCVVRFSEAEQGKVYFVAKKKGFKTTSKNVRIKNNGVLRFDLQKGNSIDFFATTRRYNYIKGLEGVSVFIDGKKMGETDAFGRFSYFHTGAKEDLIDVMLKPQGYLPEIYQTDFVIQGPMTVVKYFAPKTPPKVKISVLPLRVTGDEADIRSAQFQNKIRPVLSKNISRLKAFRNVGISNVQSSLSKSHITLSEAIKFGWNDTDLKSSVDALVIPSLRLDERIRLEISVVDSRGRVIAAAREQLSQEYDRKEIENAIATVADKVERLYPFEGTLIQAKEDYVINIGRKHGTRIAPGDQVFVWGVQSNKTGTKREHSHIATLSVTSVQVDSANAELVWKAPRATVQRGDLVQLERTANKFAARNKKSNTKKIKLKTKVRGKSTVVGSANVYFDGVWLGSTDQSGELLIPGEMNESKGLLEVSKQGYAKVSKKMTFNLGQTTTVALTRKTTYVKVSTKPANTKVYLDGRYVGKTPLSKSLALESDFVELELKAERGFKPFKHIIEVKDGSLDLTGAKEVNLEIDFIKPALEDLSRGQTDLAIKKLSEIETSHSDYLKARHTLASIYLSEKNDPQKAIEEFKKVTEYETVKSFQDKSFVSAFVNLGVAYFKNAELISEDKNWEKVTENYRRSAAEFNRVKPYLRFISKADYGNVVHSVEFHSALAKHRVALIEKDRNLLQQAYQDWKSYLDGTSAGVRLDESAKEAYVDNARIYLRQAKVTLRRNKI